MEQKQANKMALTYFSIYHPDNGCAQAHAGYETHMQMILVQYCARARHDEHGGDVRISSPYQRIFRADESYQQAATIVKRYAKIYNNYN